MKSYIITFLSTYWLDILLVVGLAALVFLLVKRLVRHKILTEDDLKDIFLALVTKAERLLGSKTGQLKKAQVIDWFYEKHPYVSIFVSQKEMSKFIDWASKKLTEILKESDVNLLSLSEEESAYDYAKELVSESARKLLKK